jgi:hypothetical protein
VTTYSPATVSESARILDAVARDLDSGELDAPRWMQERVIGARIALDAARPPAREPRAVGE